MKNSARLVFLLACDAILINTGMAIPLIFKFYGTGELDYFLRYNFILAPFLTVLYLGIFYIFRLYNRVWAYASLGELVAILQSVTLGCLGAAALIFFTGWPLPYSVVGMYWAFIIIMVGGSRLTWRIIISCRRAKSGEPCRRALIVGAGDAGAMVARELKSHQGNIIPAGFIDDDPGKNHLSLLGLPVLGCRSDIPAIVNRCNIDLIIIAMPSVESGVVREIVEICRGTKAELKILPGMYQIINGDVSVNNLRPVQLEDLLHREPVRVDLEEVAGYLRDETVLITGAGGSIGSELCRQAAVFGPRELVLLGHGENDIHNIWLELQEKFPDLPLAVEIADIREREKIDLVFKKHMPGVVFHAAAHKHVPLMELHPDEAIKTNVFGTRNVVEAAGMTGVKVFVMVSTDKAVNPTSVMGATKRIAEFIVQNQNGGCGTIFTAVRFGNVLGSSGSVVPIFQRQIAGGGPVTVTHPDMKRYFMTIPEAVQLVIQAGAIARGGEIFILDMGNPVKILDLARDMITLSGLEPDKDIHIKITGVRPGEKLEEELLTAEEGAGATKHRRIFIARSSQVEITPLEYILANLYKKGAFCSNRDIFEALKLVLPGLREVQREQVV